LLNGGQVRCWGYGAEGELGYPSTVEIGATNTPASAGPVDLGPGRTATAIGVGAYHTCAILDNGNVLCWGYGRNGRLGYGNINNVGDTQTPAAAGPVNLGPGRTATAISAGFAHTCAILDDGSVRCWGFGYYGELGYGSTSTVGDIKTPDTAGPVDLGGHTATAISAGGEHTCAILDGGSVRCWGLGTSGQLGYGNTSDVGDTPTSLPGSAGAVDLGPGRTAVAISAGDAHTCAILDNGGVLCWGYGGDGRLGYGNTNNVGDTQTPGSVGPVDLGPGRTAKAISAGSRDTCAILDNGSVLCWGYGGDGRLGYGNTNNVGDTQTPGSVGPVDLGPGRTATAISAGSRHTCAILDNGSVLCWGYGGNGRLGYCNESNVGDAQTPGSAGPVNLEPDDGGVSCVVTGVAPGGDASQTPTGAPAPAGGYPSASDASALARQARRARGFKRCLRRASRQPKRERASARRRCRARYGTTPGRVIDVRAGASSPRRIALTFIAPGADGQQPPAARAYLVKQSLRPIRSENDLARARELCRGRCTFSVIHVSSRIALTIAGLRPHTRYYYVVAARDNVTGRLGPPSQVVTARTL
jgi:alpha-tubulin suppressor-like RCC1 family protein